jgi:hypothetical protein
MSVPLVSEVADLEDVPIRNIDLIVGSIRDAVLAYPTMEQSWLEIESRIKLRDLSLSTENMADDSDVDIPASLYRGLLTELTNSQYPSSYQEYTRIWYGSTGVRATAYTIGGPLDKVKKKERNNRIILQSKYSASDVFDLNNWCKYSVSKEAEIGSIKMRGDITLDNYLPLLMRTRSSNVVTDVGERSVTRPKNNILRPMKKSGNTKRMLDVIANVKEEFITRATNKRRSFIIDEYGVRVDMTESTSPDNVVTYTVEVEILPGRNSLAHSIVNLVTATRMVARLLRGSENYYKQADLKAINILLGLNLLISDCNGNTVEDVTKDPLHYAFHLDRRVINDVRPLVPHDMRMGGIVGGEAIYCVSHKTDGQKRLLVITSWGIWLILPPHAYNLVMNAEQINGRVSGDDLTVIEGELIPPENVRDPERRSQKKYFFEVVDAHFVSGYDVRCALLPQRIKLVTQYLNSSFLVGEHDLMDMIHITYKIVHEARTVDHFRDRVMECIAERESYPYKTDGLIFTPMNMGYATGYDALAARRGDVEANKGKYAILKWKPLDEITTDFYLDQEYNLYVDARDENAEAGTVRKIFTGDGVFTYSKEANLDVTSIPKEAIGLVCEFGPAPSQQRNIILQFRRIRDDKSSPNSEAVAISNWKMMMNPVTNNTLLGEGLRMAKYYHNRIKSLLYAESPGGILLDIGSGIGADAAKWKKKYPIVFAVEKNTEYIPELTRRCTLAGYQVVDVDQLALATRDNHYVYIINDDATTNVCLNKVFAGMSALNNQSVHCISMMDSATFFWKDERTLKALGKLIESSLVPGGSIVWKVMDADLVMQRMTPESQGVITCSSEFSVVMENSEERRVTVRMEGIVGMEGQTEYLTRMKDLITILDGYDMSHRRKYKMVDENIAMGTERGFKFLLGVDETRYTTLYKYGIIRDTAARELPPLVLPEKKVPVKEKEKEDTPVVNTAPQVADEVKPPTATPASRTPTTSGPTPIGLLRKAGGRGSTSGRTVGGSLGRGRGRGFGLSTIVPKSTQG